MNYFSGFIAVNFFIQGDGSVKVYTAQEMKAAERRAVENGSSYEELMERAGQGAAARLLSFFPEEKKSALVLCGKGNNGGDGLVIARCLQAHGWKTAVLFLLGNHLSELAQLNLSRLAPDKTPLYDYQKVSDPLPPLEAYDVILDGVFGTGFSGTLPEHIQALFHLVNALPARRIALDIASGLNCDTGESSPDTFLPDSTYTFGAYKPAHRMKRCAGYCQGVQLIDIGL